MSEVVDTAAVAEIAIITVVAQTQAEEEVVMEAVAGNGNATGYDLNNGGNGGSCTRMAGSRSGAIGTCTSGGGGGGATSILSASNTVSFQIGGGGGGGRWLWWRWK